MEPWLAAYLQRHHQLCPVCAKPLELRDNRCARCQSIVRLALGSVESYQLAWGLLIAALGGVTGIGGFFDMVWLVMHEGIHGRSRGEIVLLAFLILGPVGAIALVGAIKGRRAYFRRSKLAQWGMTSVAAGVLLAMILCYMFFRR
jgi:predicted nucleic acid-binding Zn ribbon protein